jgi:hypothetical protein
MATIKFYSDEEKTQQVYPEINPVGNYPGVTVGLADNLTNDDVTSNISESFQFRSTASKTSVAEGYATLNNLRGALKTDTIPESINYNLLTTGVKAITLDNTIFKTEIAETGVYNFIYTPTLSYVSTIVSSVNKVTFAKKVSAAIGNYIFNYTPQISTTDSSSIVSSFNKITFANKVENKLGTYVFNYASNGKWYLDDELVTISEYGITTTGETAGNSIIIYYTSNSWWYGDETVALANYGIITKGTEKPGNSITIKYTENNWELEDAAITLSDYGLAIKNGAAAISDTIQIVYQTQVTSPVTIAKPLALHSVGRNQFDKDGNQIFKGYALDEYGNIIEDNSSYVIYFKCLGGNTYTIYNKNTDSTISRAAYSANIPATYSTGLTILEVVNTGSDTTQPTLVNSNNWLKHYQTTEDGYMLISASDIEGLCCSLTWSGKYEQSYVDYWDTSLPIPYADKNGTVISTYGLPYINDTYYDEIDFVEKKYYVRVGRVVYSEENKASIQASVGENNMKFDSNYIYYGKETVTYYLSEQDTNYYKVDDYGTEELIGTTLECPTVISYKEDLKDKIRRDVEIVSNKTDTISDPYTTGNSNLYPNVGAVWRVAANIWEMLGLAVDSYSTTTSYAVGDYMTKNGTLYKCVTAGVNKFTGEPQSAVIESDNSSIITTLTGSSFILSTIVDRHGLGIYTIVKGDSSITMIMPDGCKVDVTSSGVAGIVFSSNTGTATIKVIDGYWEKSYLFKV